MAIHPLLSIVIPAYNCQDTLGILLESLVNSSFKDFEVIVVDDGSDDRTVDLALKYGVRVIQQEKNQGPGGARNQGAKVAQGQYLLFLDSDTAVLPETLSETIRALEKQGNDVVLGVYDKTPLNTGFFPNYYGLLKHYAQNSVRITHYNVFAAHCAALRRCLFLESGGFQHFPSGMDIENEELGRRLKRMGCNIIFEPRIRVRHHFAGLRKLLYIFIHRTYWWMRVFLLSGEFEQSLTTQGLAIGTMACPAATLAALASWLFFPSMVSFFLLGTTTLLLVLFFYSYAGFFNLCRKEKGMFFALVAITACFFFSFFVSIGAGMGFWFAILFRFKLLKQEPIKETP